MDDDVKLKPNDRYKILECIGCTGITFINICHGHLCHRMYHEILAGLEEHIVNKGTHRLLLGALDYLTLD